jgi:hypothetical protein
MSLINSRNYNFQTVGKTMANNWITKTPKFCEEQISENERADFWRRSKSSQNPVKTFRSCTSRADPRKPADFFIKWLSIVLLPEYTKRKTGEKMNFHPVVSQLNVKPADCPQCI